MKQVVIIGNGISGITAARHIRKRSDCKIVVVSSETPYFFSRTALMYVYMGHLTFDNTKPYEDFFWKKNRIELVFDHAESIDEHQRSVVVRSGKKIPYDTLIIATGSRSNTLPAQDKNVHGVQALYGYNDLQRMEENTRGISHAVIAGGGLIGVEMAEMLRTRKIHVTMLVREPGFWNNVLPLQESQMIGKHIESHGVNLKTNQELDAIIPDANNRVKYVRTKSGEELPCDFAGISVGVHPNVELVKDTSITVRQGILVNEYLETSSSGIYAVGDCVERTYELAGRRNIEQVWYTARMMGEAVAQTVCGLRTKYAPGPWFNSAKFFDIEYQTYGHVGNMLRDDEEDLYWEHPSGKKAMHLVWERGSRRFLGINSFGFRLRHHTFDGWLRENRSIEFVIDHLDEANFDPEFSERCEAHITSQFRRSLTILNS